MQETFIIGNREFTCMRMNVFAANTLMIKAQKIIVSLLASQKSGKNLLDMDIKDAAMIISQVIDQSMFDEFIFPIFSESKLYCVEKKRFIKNPTDIDFCFTMENLFDLYELIFVLAKFQYTPFLSQIEERFGIVFLKKEKPQDVESLTKI